MGSFRKGGFSDLKKVQSDNITNYGDQRDIPSVKGTSRLSPYLASGQIHVETIWEECEKLKVKKEDIENLLMNWDGESLVIVW